VRGFDFLALWLSISCAGFQFLGGSAGQLAAAKKVQFLAPNPLKTLPRLQKCRARLALTIPSKRDML
jgi:hypothetical protein